MVCSARRYTLSEATVSFDFRRKGHEVKLTLSSGKVVHLNRYPTSQRSVVNVAKSALPFAPGRITRRAGASRRLPPWGE